MNQTPEQKARDLIDGQLVACGWVVQDKAKINLNAAVGVAVREYPTEVGLPITCCLSGASRWGW